MGISSISILGYVMPWDDQPVVLTMIDSDDLFIPIFSTIEKLEEARILLPVSFSSIKHIDHSGEFIDSIRESQKRCENTLVIMIDPYKTESGTVKFKKMIYE